MNSMKLVHKSRKSGQFILEFCKVNPPPAGGVTEKSYHKMCETFDQHCRGYPCYKGYSISGIPDEKEYC